MELQEKFAFAQKNPVYDAIPLIVLHKAEKKNYESEKFVIRTEDLTYYVSSPFWMKCRLLLFWILWAALIMAIIISILTYFCFIPRTCHSSNIQRSWHEKHEHEQIVNTSSHKIRYNNAS